MSELDSREKDRDIDHLISRSKRTSGARFPSSFARGGLQEPVLSKLIQGGRGGDVRLKLYLSMVLLGGSTRPHPVHGSNVIFDVSGPTWARVLALPGAVGEGARRVAAAQNRLAEMNLITVERIAGRAPKVVLLHASGSGDAWVEPGTPYVGVPIEIWAKRWIWRLSGKELAVYLAIIDLCGGRGRDRSGGPQALSGTALNNYGMSVDTWRIASASLEEHGLIRTDRAVVQMGLTSPRLRKRYQIVPGGLDRSGSAG